MLVGNSWVLLVVLLYSLVLPFGLLLWWKRRTGCKILPFAVGALCFVIFAMILENMLHQVVLVDDNSVSTVVKGSPMLFALYVSLAAGFFEETGRLFGFKVLLRKHKDNSTAVAYGIGHGGIEVIMLMGVTYLMIVLAKAGVKVGTPETMKTLLDMANAITPLNTVIAMFERLSAVMAHIGLSMFVFTAAKRPGKLWLYPVAVLLHALLDTVAALYKAGLVSSLAVVEGYALMCGLAFLLAGIRILHGGR